MSNSRPITKDLAEFAAKLSYEDIPQEVIEKVKLDILDTIGCGLLGSTKSDVKLARGLLKDLGGKSEAIAWGSKLRLPSPAATLTNSHASNSFELDDTYVYGGYGIHPGNNVVTSSISVSESVGGVTGKDLLTAAAAGHEIAIRVREGMGRMTSHRAHAFNVTAHCITFGAAVAAAKILDLDAEGILNAMGCAGSYVGGLLTLPPHSMVKRMVNGYAAQGGALGALLAKRGFTGIENVLEAQEGGYFLAYCDNPEPEKTIRNLGTEWVCRHLHFKRYACFTSIHAPLDAAREIITRDKIQPDEIDTITVRSTTGALDGRVRYDYKTETSAQGNLPYNVAMMFLDGEVLVDQFSKAKITSEKIRSFAKKVQGAPDQQLDALGPEHRYTAAIEVRTNNGQVCKSSLVKGPREMTAEEVRDKFRRLTSRVINKQIREKIIDTTNQLQNLKTTRKLSNLLAVSR